MTYSGDLMNFNETLTGITMELDDIIMDIFWNHITFKNKKCRLEVEVSCLLLSISSLPSKHLNEIHLMVKYVVGCHRI